MQLFDSWAGVLPPAEFDRWVIAPTRRIVDAVRAAAPKVPVIGFPRGAGLLYERYLACTGVDAVGLDGSVPASWAAQALQPKAAVQGNLDPVLLLTGGEATEAVIHEAAVAKRPIVVVPIAFVSEHSETLVELDIEYRKLADESGAPCYLRVPTVGATWRPSNSRSNRS